MKADGPAVIHPRRGERVKIHHVSRARAMVGKCRRNAAGRMSATPLRRGRCIMVWQTRVLMDDGTLIAVAIQNQMVL